MNAGLFTEGASLKILFCKYNSGTKGYTWFEFVKFVYLKMI